MDPEWDDPCWEDPLEDRACDAASWDDNDNDNEEEEEEEEKEFLGFLAGDIAADTDFLADLLGF